MQVNQARRYISRIRNTYKHDYADKYWRWLTGCIAEEPRPILVGTMAAQAVRMQLIEFYETPNT